MTRVMRGCCSRRRNTAAVYQAALVALLTQGRDLLLRNCGKDVDSLREDLLGEKSSSDFWILIARVDLCGEE